MFGIVSKKKKDVMRLVEAQISGGIDLSPEEMVDAAFLMVERINDRLYGKKLQGYIFHGFFGRYVPEVSDVSDTGR